MQVQYLTDSATETTGQLMCILCSAGRMVGLVKMTLSDVITPRTASLSRTSLSTLVHTKARSPELSKIPDHAGGKEAPVCGCDHQTSDAHYHICDASGAPGADAHAGGKPLAVWPQAGWTSSSSLSRCVAWAPHIDLTCGQGLAGWREQAERQGAA